MLIFRRLAKSVQSVSILEYVLIAGLLSLALFTAASVISVK